METASFGEWVRRRRVTLDLTQAELARRVACAPITVRKIESDERRPSKVMAERLADALELDGDSADRFVAAARAVVSPARVTTPAASDVFGPGGDLPAPPHRIIGREAETTEALDRLAVSGGPARLLTIVGPPGVGKTRLAIEVADGALRKFDVPPVFVDLSVISDPAEVPARIASTVATPSAALVDVLTLATHALRRVPTLLVLDNFEHVLDAADHVQVLLEGCPDLTCLVTSRAPLDLYGEHCLPLGPLPVEGHDDGEGDGGEGPAALDLLVERAIAVEPRLAGLVDDPDATALCRLLDGLPLALELAAHRLRDRTPAELAAQLQGGDDVLVGAGRGRGDRLRSASGSIAWSDELLDPPCRRLLRIAGTFAASFDADLLTALAQADADSDTHTDSVRRDLDELVHQGLVRATPPLTGRARRYDLLMVVRQFARERQAEAGERSAFEARHAKVVANRSEAESPGIDAWPERRDIDALSLIEADALAALAWCFGPGEDPATGRRLLFSVGPLWYFRGQVAELLRWSTAAHETLRDDEPAEDHYRSAYYLAVSKWSAGDLAGAAALIREAVRGAEAAGDATWLAEAIGIEQLLALGSGDFAAAAALTDRCTETAEAAGAEWFILAGLRGATLARLGGDRAAAEAHLARAEALVDHSGTWTRAMVAAGRGDLALDAGDTEGALARYLEAVGLFVEVDSIVYAVARTASVANALSVAGEDEQAALVCGVVEAWCDELGAPLLALAAFSHAVERAELQARLGDRFPGLVAEGRALPSSLDTVRRLASAAAEERRPRS